MEFSKLKMAVLVLDATAALADALARVEQAQSAELNELLLNEITLKRHNWRSKGITPAKQSTDTLNFVDQQIAAMPVKIDPLRYVEGEKRPERLQRMQQEKRTIARLQREAEQED